MSERDNLILAVSDDNDWTFLELQAEELALTKEQVVAMLIRKARKAYERPTPMSAAWAPPDAAEIERAHQDMMARRVVDEDVGAKMRRDEAEYLLKREEDLRLQAERAATRARLQAELAALEADPRDSDIQADQTAEAAFPSLPEFDESLLRQPEPDPIRSAIIPSSAAPGSLTGPVGIRRDLKGGDVMGDARANIIRRNFKHLGSG